MDVWEVPVSSCPGLDRGPLMDVGPQQIPQIELRRSVEETGAREAPPHTTPNASRAPKGGTVGASGRVRDERKERQWRHWISQWRASGPSVRAFCVRHRL